MTDAPSMSPSSHAFFDNNPLNEVLGRKPMKDDAHFDITAMIDLVFMMNIFFLVTWVGSAMTEIDLPAVQHAAAVDGDMAVFVTVQPDFARDSVKVFIGDGEVGEALTEHEAQEKAIRRAVEEGRADGKNAIVFKAEKKIRLREIARLTSAAALEGMQLNMAVLEKN